MKQNRHLVQMNALLLLGLCMAFSNVSLAQLTAACNPSYTNNDFSHYISSVTLGTTTYTQAYNEHDKTSSVFEVIAGNSYSVSLTSIGWCGVGIAADLNNDGDFNDASEVMLTPSYQDGSPMTYNLNITIPPSTLTGSYRIRFWNRTANSGDGSPVASPCGAYGYGSWVDYKLNVTNNNGCQPPASATISNILPTSADLSWTASTSSPNNYIWKVVNNGDNPVTAPGVANGTTAGLTGQASGLTPATNYQLYIMSACASENSLWSLPFAFQTPCDGMPEAGTVNTDLSSVCATSTFHLTLTGASAAAAGISYHWQSSTTGNEPWANITGNTANITVTNQMAATYYRVYVACSGSGLADTSDAVLVNQNPATDCYCFPTYSNGGGSDNITNVVLGNLSHNTSSAGNPVPHYFDYTTDQTGGTLAIPDLIQGSNHTLSVTFGSDGNQYSRVWFDFNQNGIFEANESFTTGVNAGGSGTANIAISIPLTATPGNTRMRIRGADDSQPGDNQSCNASNSSYGEAEDYLVNIVALQNCAGTPTPGNTIATVSSFCASGSTTLSLENNFVSYSGISWQWQKSANGSDWEDITNATSYNFTTPTISTTTQYRCRLICNAGPDTAYSNPATITIHPLPVVTVSPATATFCSSAPIALTGAGADTYTWSPATGLDATAGTTVNASPTGLTTYTVTGTDVNGCQNTATSSVGPISDIHLSASLTYTGACEAGNPITISVDPVTTTSGSMEYEFRDQNDGVLQAFSAATDFTTTPTVEGVDTYKVYGRNTDCPADVTSTPAIVTAVIGFAATVTASDASCSGDNDGSIAISDVTGPGLGGLGLSWYNNDFTSSLLDPSMAALYGSATGNPSISGGVCTLTPNEGGRRGALGIFNPMGVNPQAFQISFDLNISSTNGADGISWNYGDDAAFNANNQSPEDGSTSKLAIGFDAYANGSNSRGIYLIYNGGWIGTTNTPTPTTTGVLQYSNNLSWAGANKTVIINVDESGKLTMSIGGTVIFNQVQLPAGYVNADKSTWKQLFDSRTGGVTEAHVLDNINITYDQLVYNYGLSDGNSGQLPTQWQTNSTFNNLAPGSYDVWIANPNDPENCHKMLGTYTISAPLSIAASPENNFPESSCDADDGALALTVNNLGTYTVHYSLDGGADQTMTGVVATNLGGENYIVASPLPPGSYSNIKVVDESSSCNSNTLAGPDVIIPYASSTIASTTSGYTVTQASATTVNYVNDDCEKIADITSTADLGSVTADVTLGAVLYDGSNNPYLGRYYEITPTDNSSSSATITLYYSDDDINEYNTAVAGMEGYYPIDPNAGNMVVCAFHGSAAAGTNGPGGQFDTTGHDVIVPTSFNHIDNYWAITFTSSNGFSGFFTNGSDDNVLPILLGDIKATNNGEINVVDWNTLNESDGKNFDLMRSADGKHFTTIATLDVKGKPSTYQYVDRKPLSGINYYQLALLHNSGQKIYSKVVSAVVKDNNFDFTAFPNPTTNNVNVRISGAINGNAKVILTDATGRVIKTISVDDSYRNINISLDEMALGLYLLKYEDDVNKQTIKINKL